MKTALFIALGLAVAVVGPGSLAPAYAQSQLATRASLSPDAIKLQSASNQLPGLAQQQQQARDREKKFAGQATMIGAGAGALAGAAAGCAANKIGKGGTCKSEDYLIGALAGGLIGAFAGNQQGKQVAQDQNTAAARENELKRRLQIASKQYSTAQTARTQAEKVLAQRQRELRAMKQQVAAGKATKAQLAQAQANASADAQVIKAAVVNIDQSGKSLGSDQKTLQSQGKSGQQLAQTQKALESEEALTQRQYDALVKEIKSSAM